MNTLFLSLGSNLGNRWQNLSEARRLIDSGAGRILMTSHVFEAEPWGISFQDNFLNQVLKINTELNPVEILKKTKSVESVLGRNINDNKKYQPRQMDIDILFFNDEIIRLPELTIPHPALHERNFVLVPLCEIAAEFIHPVLKKTIYQLSKDCKDEKWVRVSVE